MIRVPVAVIAFLAPLFFPWPLALAAAVVLGFFSPLALAALGIFADTLSLLAGAFPWWSVAGLAGAAAAFFIRKFIKASVMEV